MLQLMRRCRVASSFAAPFLANPREEFIEPNCYHNALSNIEFTWDVRKARSNFDKHGVSFEEAEGVFVDPLKMTQSDVEHSDFSFR